MDGSGTGRRRGRRQVVAAAACSLVINLFCGATIGGFALLTYPRSSASSDAHARPLEAHLLAPADLAGEWSDTAALSPVLTGWIYACLELGKHPADGMARVDLYAADDRRDLWVSDAVLDDGSEARAAERIDDLRTGACGAVTADPSYAVEPVAFGASGADAAGFITRAIDAGPHRATATVVARHVGARTIVVGSYAYDEPPVAPNELLRLAAVTADHVDDPTFERPGPPFEGSLVVVLALILFVLGATVIWPARRLPVFGVLAIGVYSSAAALLVLSAQAEVAEDLAGWAAAIILLIGLDAVLVARSMVATVERRAEQRIELPDGDPRAAAARRSRSFTEADRSLVAAGFTPVDDGGVARAEGRSTIWSYVDPAGSTYAELILTKRPWWVLPLPTRRNSPVTLWTPVADHQGVVVTMGWRCIFAEVPTEIRFARPGEPVAALIDAHRADLERLRAWGLRPDAARAEDHPGAWALTAARSRQWLLSRPVRTGFGTFLATLRRRHPGRGEAAARPGLERRARMIASLAPLPAPVGG